MGALRLCFVFIYTLAFSQAFTSSGTVRAKDIRIRRQPTVTAVGSGTDLQAAEEWLIRAKRSHRMGDDAAAMRYCEKSLRLSDSCEATELARSVRDTMLVARVMQAPDDFEVLQLSRLEAECLTQLERAYKKQARQVHPDTNCAQQAQAAFVRVQGAYEAFRARSVHLSERTVSYVEGGTMRSPPHAEQAARAQERRAEERCEALSQLLPISLPLLAPLLFAVSFSLGRSAFNDPGPSAHAPNEAVLTRQEENEVSVEKQAKVRAT